MMVSSYSQWDMCYLLVYWTKKFSDHRQSRGYIQRFFFIIWKREEIVIAGQITFILHTPETEMWMVDFNIEK